jgi:hypothetical protein
VNIIRELEKLDRLKDIDVIHGEWHGAKAREDIRARMEKSHETDMPLRHPDQKGGVWFAKRRNI